MNRQLEQKSILNSLEILTDEQIHILNEFINSFIVKPNNLQTKEEFIDNNLVMKNNPETYSFLQNDYNYSIANLKEVF